MVRSVPLGSKARPIQRLARLVLPTLDSPNNSSLTVKMGSSNWRGETVMDYIYHLDTIETGLHGLVKINCWNRLKIQENGKLID